MSEESNPAFPRVAVWRKNVADGRLSWSKGLSDLFDLPPGEVNGQLDAVLPKVHPDDRGTFQDALSGVTELDEPRPTRVRVVREDRSIRVVEIDWDFSWTVTHVQSLCLGSCETLRRLNWHMRR